MYQNYSPITNAYEHLVDLAKESHSYNKAHEIALCWIAGSRMVAQKTISGLSKISELGEFATWEMLNEFGLPLDGIKQFFDRQSSDLSTVQEALKIVTLLDNTFGKAKWDILSTLAYSKYASEVLAFNDVRPDVAEIMLDLIGKPNQGSLWLPFDSNGLLAIRALRHGWRVNAVQMLDNNHTGLKLLLAIEYGSPVHPDVNVELSWGSDGYPKTDASNVIAIPPIKLNVQNTNLMPWALGYGGTIEQFNRSENMAVFNILRRVENRSVFLLPASVLFASGQEQLLREYIVEQENQRHSLEAVISMPGGVFPTTGLASALWVFGPAKDTPIRMVDLGVSKRSMIDVDEMIKKDRPIILGKTEDTKRSCLIAKEECRSNNYVLTPSRYFSKKVNVGANAVPLGEICELIRPPILARSEKNESAIEIGIQELSQGSWTKTKSSFDKNVMIRSSSSKTYLQDGDLLLSLKGTVGKVGILRDLDQNTIVASQSCAGLRVVRNEKTISPEYLLMFLRSGQGQAQLNTLAVGASVQHINIKTLLESYKVPMPDKRLHNEVLNDYENLCQVEREISLLEERSQAITQSRWSLN